MPGEIKREEKYERNGWPSLPRPDLKPPEGWSLKLLTAVSRVRNHRLSPDGTTVAFIWDHDESSDVYTIPSAGGWPARVSVDRGPAIYWADEIPKWSPDGRWLAFTLAKGVHIVSVAGGLPKKISDFADEASSPVWMPDSRGILVCVDRARESVQLLMTDREGSWPKELVTLPGDVRDAWPSPDGRSVAFIFRPHDDPNRLDVRLVDVASGKMVLLSGAPRQKDWWPRWSPDGQRIAFLSQRSGYDEVWLIGRDGGALRQLTHVRLEVSGLSWSPDGKRLAATINREGALDLALIDVESGEVSYLKSGRGVFSRPNWSPDGTFLTVEYEGPTQPPDLYRVSLPGGEMTQLTFSMPPALAHNALVTPHVVRYKSFDGMEIPAYLFTPIKPNGAAIVVPHGGPADQCRDEWDEFAQYLAAKGYTLLMPNYRGSTGYGLAFEHANYNDWGGGDAQDCLFAARYMRTLAGIDPQRIAIMGSSQGGYLVACCLSRDADYLYACGVDLYGDAHIPSSWALCDRDLRIYTEMMLGHPARNRLVYTKGSPIFEVERVQKPVLILHGLEDDIVPPEASEAWVEALRRAGKTYEYKTYAGEPHGFLRRTNRLDSYARIERFLDWYLMPTSPLSPAEGTRPSP